MLLTALVVTGAVASSFALRSSTARRAAEVASERGEIQLRRPMRPIHGDRRVLLLAFDGVGHGALRDALAAGRLSQLRRLTGADRGDGLFEHGYAASGVLSILPSTTMAAWASIFTGQPPSRTGVPGNEWFVREERRFYAPGPVSVDEHAHSLALYSEGLLGRVLRTATLFELADVRAHVALSPVSRGADLLTVPALGDVVDLFGKLAAGIPDDDDEDDDEIERAGYETMDKNSAERLVEAMNAHGVPDLQVLYMPGIDLYTHLAHSPLDKLQQYLAEVVDPTLRLVLDAYEAHGALDETYVVVVSDHGHTPVLAHERQALQTGHEGEPPQVLEQIGFRVRPFVLELDDDQEDYQAVLAYQGAIAYVYLADRSTCPRAGDRCDWTRPPRLQEDVIPVLQAFASSNGTGAPIADLEGTLDLVLSREPRPVTEPALPFRVWNGERLVAIGEHLRRHPRPDLLRFEARMAELGAGPYGHRAGDVLLLARSGGNRPIEERYYFSRKYRSWHGSPEAQDSVVPLLVARAGVAGNAIRDQVERVLTANRSQLAVTPLIRALLRE